MATKAEKAALMQEFRERAEKAQLMVVAEYKGLSVEKLTALRRELRSKGGEFSVYKNTLARISSQNVASKVLENDFKGPVGILFVRDNPMGALKTLVDYAKENPGFSIRAGVFEGQRLDVKSLGDLSKIPDRATLYAQLLGLLSGPLAKTAQGLNQVLQKLAIGLNEYSKTKGS